MRTFTSRMMVAATALLTLVSATPVLAQSRASRPTVAVLDLDFAAVQRWWEGNWDVGKGVADLIVDELVNDGTYRVIERKRLDALLAPLGYDVRSVEVRGCLHLKTAVTQVAPGVLLMNRAWVDAAPWPGFDVIDVDPAEPMAANALLVGDRVLCADAFPRTIARLRAAGLAPLAIDVSEIAKAEGGLTCCSLIFAAPAGLLASGDDV